MRKSTLLSAGLTVLLSGWASGCAFLPLESHVVPGYPDRIGPEVAHDYREAVGVIHVHSRYSDGGWPVERIAQAANAQKLDFLILTDHNTLRGRADGKQGLHGRTLVLVDEEISTRGGHTLALRLPREVESGRDPQATVDAVAAAGGLGFIAHPFSRRSSWTAPEAAGMTGLEIYSLREDVEDENPLILGPWALLTGADFSMPAWLDRPTELLAYWDRLLARGGKVVGIGSSNAHGLQRFGLRLAPYGTTFKMVRNHLLIRGELTGPAVYEALEQGRLFVAHDVVSEGNGFLFAAVEGRQAQASQGRQAGRGGQIKAVMGEEVRFSPALKLYVYLPRPGRIRLFRSGAPVGEGKGQHAWFTPAGPGVYRVEATRRGRAWIYSNPIYVIE